jgi:TRAP-type mannitol/chloroaromatic compound transport system permease small subunit
MYISGVLYALGLWQMIDASIFSKTINASLVHVSVVDWIPFVCSTLGMIVVNSLDKVQLVNVGGGGFDSSGSQLQWQARVVLFIGFSLLAVGFSGSILVLVLKFLIKGFTDFPTVKMGTENVGANFCVMISCTILWVVSTMEEDNSLAL